MTGIGCPNSWQSINLAGLGMGTVHLNVILFPITSSVQNKEKKESVVQ